MPNPTRLAPAHVSPLAAQPELGPTWQEIVEQKVKSLHYGVVQIVVHDSHVVQVESTERHRFDLRRTA